MDKDIRNRRIEIATTLKNHENDPVKIQQLADDIATAIVSPEAQEFLVESQIEGVEVQGAVFDTPLQGFPTEGDSFAVLSTGIAAEADNPDAECSTNTEGPSENDEFDIFNLLLTFDLPTNAGVLSFDWKLATNEAPPTNFNDNFRVDIISPAGTSNIFDTNVNSVSLTSSGTDNICYNLITPDINTAVSPLDLVAGETITLRIHIADVDDPIADTAAFIDNINITVLEGRRQLACEKIRTEQVICDEIFYFEDEETEVPINYFSGVDIPSDSNVSGTVTVSVQDCEVFCLGIGNETDSNIPLDLSSVLPAKYQGIDVSIPQQLQQIYQQVGLCIIFFTFIVQKELEITTPEGIVIPLEFAERIPRIGFFRKCFPSDFDLINVDIDDIFCQIVNTEANDVVTINETPANTFNEDLNIQVKVKLVQEIQQVVSLCPDNNQVNVAVQQILS